MQSQVESTMTPNIGLLSVDLFKPLEYYGNYKSYIAASYVKFLEGSGANVIPIWIGKDEIYYEEIMKKLNGVLLPGGAVFFNEKDGYADAGRHIYNIALKMNNNGEYMPLLGICLGYELLLEIASGGDIRQDCSCMNIALPLNFKEDFQNSRMFKEINNDLIEDFGKKHLTFNYHKYCITEQDLLDKKISEDWKVLSTNKDKYGLTYISTIEHARYPFYGLQFHPEKNEFEETNCESCHSESAVLASRYFSNFFVNEARKSEHFLDPKDNKNYVISAFPITDTLEKSKYKECYLFMENVDYPEKV